MSMERIRLNGLQDRSLEIRRNHSTSTKDSDISQRARLYKGLAQEAAVASMALEGMQGGRGTPEMVEVQTAQIRAIRHDAVASGFNLQAFDLVVKDKVALLKKKEEEKEADWKLINKEFPGQFEGWEKQAFMGDVPPRNDAGGFKMKRRGW